ncbi:unnamed protein product [Calicophoron daubneyi]|uniref:Uncharacterized protein n=1 Tax=Calicophoron daubneyi TaxID=300641 RepID=A0AAV2TTI8_CALDB
MHLYNPAFYFPTIQPPRIDFEIPDPTVSGDDRVKISEVEAAFEELENELSAQVCQQLSPIGKGVGSFATAVEEFITPGTSNSLQRPSAPTRTAPVHSPLFTMGDSFNLTGETSGLDLLDNTPPMGSSRMSYSRLPRRVVGSRMTSTTTTAANITTSTTVSQPTASVPLIRCPPGQRSTITVGQGSSDSIATRDLTSTHSFNDPVGGSSSGESPVQTTGLAEAESSDNLLADEEEEELLDEPAQLFRD